LKQAQARCDEYRIQLLDFANEANQTQNAQQNQLQGVEAVRRCIILKKLMYFSINADDGKYS